MQVPTSAGSTSSADNTDGAQQTPAETANDHSRTVGGSPSPRPVRSATVGSSQSTSAIHARREANSRDDTQAIEEEDENEPRQPMHRAKTMAGGVGLPLGGFLPQGGSGPMRPSDLKKANNNNAVTKPSRRAPAPTPPGRHPPPAPGATMPSEAPEITQNGVNGGLQPSAVTPTPGDDISDITNDSRCPSDEEDAIGGDDDQLHGAGSPQSGPDSGSQHVTSPSNSSLLSPQHAADGEGSSFSMPREHRRSGLRTAMEWSVDEVANWLHLMDLPDLGPTFIKFDVDGQKLLNLDSSKFKVSQHVCSTMDLLN